MSAAPPVNVTKLALGGEGLRTAFVTTARNGLTPDQFVLQPLAGGLFAFDASVPGFTL
jgi:xylono-1,5-lactonase